MSVRLSVCNNSAPTGRIFVKFDILRIFENMSTKFKFHKNLTRMTGPLHEDQYIYIYIYIYIYCIYIFIYRWIPTVRAFSERSFEENKNTHRMFNFLIRKSYLLWERGKISQSQTNHRRQYGAYALHAGYLRLHTHSEYVILSAFPLQQCLQECASVLCYIYIACLACI